MTATLGELAQRCGGEVRTGPFGSQLHKSDYVDDPAATPVVMPKDMIDGRVDTSSIARVDPSNVDRLRQHVLREGDIVLARRGEIGRRAWIGPDEDGMLCGTGSMRVTLRGSSEVRPHFIHHYLATDEAIGWLEGHAVGATMSNLSAGVVEELPISFPSIEEQDRVLSVLVSIEHLLGSSRRRIEILEEMARLIYREGFVHFRVGGKRDLKLVDSEVGPIPRGWRPTTFGDLVSVSRYAVDPEEIEPSAPVVGLEHLPRRSITLCEWEPAEDVGSRRSSFKSGDILFGKIRPYFHKVVSAPVDGYCSTDAIVFRPGEEYASRALAVASSDEFVAHAVQTSNGTKMPRANTEVLLDYPAPSPPPEIERAFDETVGPMIELCKNLAAQNRVLTELRDLLLPRLISGELDVSDLDLDLEPAG